MALASTPEEDAALLRMAVVLDQPPIDWIILHLPNGRYAAFWEQGLGIDHTTAVVNGDYTACAFVADSLEDVKDYIRQGYREQISKRTNQLIQAYIDENYSDFLGW